MKMVKSLLLGTAAGLVAVTAGQAADLPVKAKPVEYVKVCSLYGAGFYYMPGTDMCIKIGGWTRVEATMGTEQAGSLAWGPFNGNEQQRTTNHFQTRARGYITADAREQTAYGTARAYIDVGVSSNDTGTGAGEGLFTSNRAFLQWAGITAGVTQSFYDFYSAPAALYRAGYLPNEDTGDGGWWVWGYTAQLGNGLSATVSAEQRRMSQILDNTAAGAITNFATTSSVSGIAGGVSPGLGYGGMQAPDVVANLRLDQTWGSAQVMAAMHEVNPTYYGAAATPILGHPSDTWGWVVGAGLRLNVPMIAQGDYFQGEVNYTKGALRYLNHGADTNYDQESGATQAFGVQTDCVYGGTLAAANTTGCNLTTAWSVNASFEHYWTPSVHQSLAGAYMAVHYNAQANAMLCSGAGDAAAGTFGATAIGLAGCNNNWSVWGLGSRLQWDITKSFYIGVEGLYTQMQGGTTSDGLLHGYSLDPGVATNVTRNESNWSGTVRMHKDFLP